MPGGGRERGMDHDIHPFSPVAARPEFRLAGGARLAVYLLLHIEYWELEPPAGAHRDPRFRGEFGAFFPEYRAWSQREYGNRIGAYRILEALDRHRLPATAAVDLLAARRHPNLLEEVRARGYEIAGHGIAVTRMITSRMTETEERACLAEARDGLAALTGAPPASWLGPDHGATPRTSRLLAELGFRYTLDWANDEEPYLHHPPDGIVALPAPGEWDDAQTLWLRRVPVQKYPDLVGEAVERLLAEPRGGRVLGLGLHPWVLGAPHRIRYLREALERVAGRPGVLIATAGEIAAQFRAQHGAA